MSEEPQEKLKPVFLIVPRKLVITWVVSTFILFLLNIASFQYTNYVDRRSNGLWCGIINLFDDTYQKTPPPTSTGQILAREFNRIRKGYNCK